ncbi:MAG: HPP family protein [Nitrospirae bacterium]|nr:HPP family protein [Nitrospirota bacterium]
MKMYFSRWKPKGQCPPRKPLKKILWSWFGSFVGIFLIAMLEELLKSDGKSHLLLIGSFGASAVLIYGAPQADFSQPRNLIGGHILSALVGVTIYSLMKEHMILSCSMSVSLSIAVMHATRTMHPPGGATALIAVIGGDSIGSLGYKYILSPVLSGAIILLFIALIINNLSSNPKRHYPTYWL